MVVFDRMAAAGLYPHCRGVGFLGDVYVERSTLYKRKSAISGAKEALVCLHTEIIRFVARSPFDITPLGSKLVFENWFSINKVADSNVHPIKFVENILLSKDEIDILTIILTVNNCSA